MKNISERLDQDLFLWTRGEVGFFGGLKVRFAMLFDKSLRERAKRYDRVGEVVGGMVRGELSQPLIVNVGHSFAPRGYGGSRQRLILLTLLILLMSMAVALVLNHTIEARAVAQNEKQLEMQDSAPIPASGHCGVTGPPAVQARPPQK